MAQAVHRRTLPSLNTDGRQHPLANTLTALTAFFGVVSLVCAAVDSWHIPGAWAGAAGLVVGTFAQLVSATTAERWVNVCAWIASFIGLLLNMGHGGLM